MGSKGRRIGDSPKNCDVMSKKRNKISTLPQDHLENRYAEYEVTGKTYNKTKKGHHSYQHYLRDYLSEQGFL